MILLFLKRVGQLFCTKSLDLGLSGFLKIRVTHFWQECQRSNVVSFSVHNRRRHVISFCPVIGDNKLDHLIVVDHYKDAFPLSVQTYLSDSCFIALV